MIYYFVSSEGYLSSEEHPKGWYEAGIAFTNRKKAIAEAKRRTKVRIAELKDYCKELECYRHTE